MIRACLLKENKYDELIKTAEDADLWLKVANKTKFYNIPEYLLYYRMHSQNTTGRNRQDVLIASSKIWYERCFDVYSLDSHYKELYLRFLFECLYGEGVYSSKMANEEVDTLFKYLQEVYHAKKYFYDVLLRMYTSFCVKGYKWNKILFNPFSKKNFLMYIKHLIFLIWRKMSNKSLVG